jgi:hypothetical protein
MKRHGLVLLVVALVAAGAAACFKDPTSGLRGGGAVLSLSDKAVYLRTGDSVAVVAELKDNQGNVLPATGATWTAADPTIAVVRTDTVVVPGNYFTRGFIRGVTNTGNWTNVIVAAGNVADTLRVTVIPATFAASLVGYAGAAKADTAKNVAYSAPDTLVLSTGSSLLTFDTSAVSAYSGAATGYIIAKTPTSIRVVFNTAAVGKVVVKKILFNTGNASVGTIKIDSLVTDSLAVARVRFTGAISQLGDTMTVNASPNQSFSAASGVSFGAKAGIILSQTATTMSVLSPVAYTGQVTVTGLTMGIAAIPAMTTNAVAPYSINAATFPQANVAMSPNNARLGDTVIVTAPTGLTFVTSGAGKSNVILGNTAIATSDTGWILSATTSTLKVFAMRGGTGNLSVTNLKLGSGAVIPSLTTPNPVPIDSVATDMVVDTTQGTAQLVVVPANGTLVLYGTALPGALHKGFSQNYITFVTATPLRNTGTLYWFGSGNPYGSGTNTVAYTEDLDQAVCNASTKCDQSGADLANQSVPNTWGAAQPESWDSQTALPAGRYWINVIGFNVKYSLVYKMVMILQ